MRSVLLVAVAVWLGLAVCRGADHPRLLFPDAKVAKLKEPAARAQVVALAQKGKLDAWCLAYRVTGEKQYAEKVRAQLLRDCRAPAAGEPVKPWPWGLAGAHKCYDVALGYDCIYDFLSPEDRTTIRTALIARGIEPMLAEWVLGQTRTTALDAMGHNFWAACIALPGIAALAIMDEEPRAKEWLPKVVQATDEWFSYPGSVLDCKPANFDPAGGYYESVGYTSYGLSMYLTFRLAWRNATGDALPEKPILAKVGDFFLNACYPNDGELLSLNFGDSSLHAVGSQPLVLLWANGIRQPRHLWYLKLTENSTFREGLRRDSPLGMVYFPTDEDFAAAPAQPDLPTAAIYPDMGWAMLRSSWDRNATLLGVKSGFTWNHAHADAGSFILCHRGQNLLIDSGNCWYVHPQYDDYYRQSRAHNVVLFNGEGQSPEDPWSGSKFPGSVQHLIDRGDLKYVLADATGPNARNFTRNYRHFLWLDDVIVILDDLKTYQPGQFEWLLHVDGEAKRSGLDLNVQLGAAKVSVRPLFPERFPEGFVHDAPERLKLLEKSGLKDHQEKTPVSYYALVPPGQTRVMKFVTAILLNPDRPPPIERLETIDMIGLRLQQGERTTSVYMNLLADGRRRHRNANLTVDGWETDANLLVVTANGATPSRFFVANGSYLRRDGEVRLDSLHKVFAVIENGQTTVY